MIKFYGKESEFYKGLRKGCSIANTLSFNTQDPITLYLFASLYCGHISYHQFYSMGLFCDKNHVFLSENAKKAVSYYEKAGYLTPGFPLGESNRCKTGCINRQGLNHLTSLLKRDALLDEDSLSFLPSLYSATRRWQNIKNVVHYDGISSFLCTMLSYGTVSMLMREVNVFNYQTHTRATCYFRGSSLSAFRMDAYALIGTDPSNHVKGQDTKEGQCHIFYEQDTGTQTGNVLSAKIQSYLPFLQQYRQSEPSKGFLLLFGLMGKDKVKIRHSYKNTLFFHQNSKEYRALKAVQFALLLQKEDCSIKELMSRLKLLSKTNTGYDIISTIRIMENSYASFCQFCGMPELMAEDIPDICQPDTLKVPVNNSSGSSTSNNILTHPLYDSMYSARAYVSFLNNHLCESKKDTDKPLEPCEYVEDADIEDITDFFTRRNLLYRKCVEEINAAPFADASIRGLRVCGIPTTRMRDFFPFLCPYETGLFHTFKDFLLENGVTVHDMGDYAPVFSFSENCTGVNYFRYSYREGDLSVFYENFSFDLSSRLRIPAVMHTLKTFQTDALMVCFFARQDLPAVREFATTALSPFSLKTHAAAFSHPASGSILFVCMEDYLSGSYKAIRFCSDGLGAYPLIMDYATGNISYQYICNDAAVPGETVLSSTLP